MATLQGDDNNPSGIVFDDPGPGAGLKAPGVPKVTPTPANKIAQVAAKAKVVPGVKATTAAKAVAAAPVKKGQKVWGFASIERYKAQDQLNSLEAQGKTIFAIVTSPATQNAYDVFYY